MTRCERCGEESVYVESVYEKEYGYGGWTNDTQFQGVRVYCLNCRAESKYDIDDLEDMVRDRYVERGFRF